LCGNIIKASCRIIMLLMIMLFVSEMSLLVTCLNSIAERPFRRRFVKDHENSVDVSDVSNGCLEGEERAKSNFCIF
jgi:hypothetical protein